MKCRTVWLFVNIEGQHVRVMYDKYWIQIKSSIMEKYHKQWSKLARHQSKCLFTMDINYIKDTAQILSDVYDLEKFDRIETKKCSLCQEMSKKRCSKCKKTWYCSRSVRNTMKMRILNNILLLFKDNVKWKIGRITRIFATQ